jgi:predicted ATPase
MRASTRDRNSGDGGYLREVCLLRDRVPSFSRYPFSLPAVRHLTSLALHPQVTFLIGENGSGKSTLLEGIAVAWGFNAEGGSRNFAFATRESHSELADCLRLNRAIARPHDGFFLRAESFYNVATEIERLDEEPAPGRRVIDSYGGRSLHEQSHGESFWALFMHRFGACGLYLLDEPEAALSPTRQLAMLTRLHQLVGQHSQFIIATHSPIILAYPHSKIVQLSPEGPAHVPYEETEHYLVTRQFLSNPERMLALLLQPDAES